MSEPYYDPSDRTDDDLTREEFEAAMAKSAITPVPWRVGNWGSVVADAAVPEMPGSDSTDYYGGHLVCESVTPSNAEFIVRACNLHQPMLDLLIELIDIEGPQPGNASWAEKVSVMVAKATGKEGA